MAKKQLAPEIRRMAELLHAEVVGRLYACEKLEDETERIEDSRVLYGWSLLTQEVLIRLAEASLKLLYLIHFNRPSKRGHSLVDLWAQLPKEVQQEVNVKRFDFPGGERGVSFEEYDMDDFQNVRYSHERHPGGQITAFETRRLFLDSFAVTNLAEEWLGEIRAWPWAEALSTALTGYRISPIGDGKFDVLIDHPIEPMDWAGAIIEPTGEQYVWTLYCGFTDEAGKGRSFQIPALLYEWPIEELVADSVGECAEKVYRAYQEPCYALLEATQETENHKQLIDQDRQ